MSGKANATVEALISILNRLSILGMTAGMSWQFLLTSPSSKSLIRVFTHIQKDSGKELFWHESKRCAHCNTKLTLTCQCLYRATYLLLARYLTCFRTVQGLLIKTLWVLYQKGFRIILFRDMLWCRLVNWPNFILGSESLFMWKSLSEHPGPNTGAGVNSVITITGW